MPLSIEQLQRLLNSAQENLNMELKSWIDPSTDSGKATIAKACIALRNGDGGFLVIGLRNDGACDDRPQPELRTKYHLDTIQRIIHKYSSDSFEVVVHFVERGGSERVMIEVPSGVRTPVQCKQNLPRNDSTEHKQGSLLRENAFYVRTIGSNGTPSTSEASRHDWPKMMEHCFNNREADIGAFVRRQLSGVNLSELNTSLAGLLQASRAPVPTEQLADFLDKNFATYIAHATAKDESLATLGSRECAAMITGKVGELNLTRSNMNRFAAIRRYSGWPPFVGLLNLHSNLGSTQFIDGGWNSFEFVPDWQCLNFSRIDGQGMFSDIEGFRDDLHPQARGMRQLDFVFQTQRVAETILSVLEMSKVFCGQEANNDVLFRFRWKGLSGRRLTSWTDSRRGFVSWSEAAQDTVTVDATMPVTTSSNAIGAHVEDIVRRLFILFGGWEFDSGVIQQIVNDLKGSRV